MHVALVGGAAALAGAAATISLGHGSDDERSASAAGLPLWARPAGWNQGWAARKGKAVLSRTGMGLAAAVANPAMPVAIARLHLRIPLGDPLLLADAPVTVTLAYALEDRLGWADARIDARPADARRRFEVIGAVDGAGEMRFVLPADAVRARGAVALDVALRVRTLAGGSARLVLRSVTVETGS